MALIYKLRRILWYPIVNNLFMIMSSVAIALHVNKQDYIH